MTTITRFEDIKIWQQARLLNKDIYPFLKSLSESRNYELNKQIERSAGSIMDNIAEGFEREGNREFIQFLAISKASAGEVRSQLYRALDRELIGPVDFDKYQSECILIGKKLGKFMNYLNSTDIKGRKFRKS